MTGVSTMLRRLTRGGRTPLLAAGSTSIGEKLALSSAAAASYFILADVNHLNPMPLFTSQFSLNPSSNLQSSAVFSHYRSHSSSASSGRAWKFKQVEHPFSAYSALLSE